ncbi:uncharacterized protein [Eurosta solidaginis]|uniref:uncharacterized protein n=1 Tax=Eurosta solidaginis TaxID=178769 RepID=UPI003530FFAD
MELRSAKRNYYKTTLVSLGLYEDGMELEEMKQMMHALEESQLVCDTVLFETDFERARKKNEGSPETASEKFIVEAIVHHELNWSPPLQERELDLCLVLENENYNNIHIEKRKSIENEDGSWDIKRSRQPFTSSPKSSNESLRRSAEWQSEYQVPEEYDSDPSF